ncbi:MAG: hypothetical protein ABII74_06875 [Elusimicrobiota bacterium]
MERIQNLEEKIKQVAELVARLKEENKKLKEELSFLGEENRRAKQIIKESAVWEEKKRGVQLKLEKMLEKISKAGV